MRSPPDVRDEDVHNVDKFQKVYVKFLIFSCVGHLIIGLFKKTKKSMLSKLSHVDKNFNFQIKGENTKENVLEISS